MQLNLYRYLTELRSNAKRFERKDINDYEEKRYFFKNFRRIICIIISVLFVLFLREGFSSDFVSHTSTVLSILIGLFISAIIFSFDKFYKPQHRKSQNLRITLDKKQDDYNEKEYLLQLEDVSEPKSKETLWNTHSFNFAKQFAYITGYSIILSVFVITFLSFSTMFPSFLNIDIWQYHFDFDVINGESLSVFFNVFITVIYRFIVLYWLIGIIYYTLFIVSSMVNFMTVKMEKDSKN